MPEIKEKSVSMMQQIVDVIEPEHRVVLVPKNIMP
jgi:hypothetical protein